MIKVKSWRRKQTQVQNLTCGKASPNITISGFMTPPHVFPSTDTIHLATSPQNIASFSWTHINILPTKIYQRKTSNIFETNDIGQCWIIEIMLPKNLNLTLKCQRFACSTLLRICKRTFHCRNIKLKCLTLRTLQWKVQITFLTTINFYIKSKFKNLCFVKLCCTFHASTRAKWTMDFKYFIIRDPYRWNLQNKYNLF